MLHLSSKYLLGCRKAYASDTTSMINRLCSTSTLLPWPKHSKQLMYERHGATTNVLSVKKTALPALSDDDVGVAILRAPVNPADVNTIEGVYPLRPPVPAVGGSEGVGVVARVGANVTNLKIGDWVIPRTLGIGTWQSHIVCNSVDFIPVPNDIPVEYAAILTVNPPTAFRMLADFVDLEEGDTIAQNGATSAVGRAVIQMAAARGIRSINVIRDRPNIEEVTQELKALGATHVITETSARLPDTRAILKKERPARLGLNCVGGKSCAQIVRFLGNDAVLVTYGGMAKEPVTLPTASQIFQNISAVGFWMSKWYTDRGYKARKTMVEDIAEMVRKEQLHYPFALHGVDEWKTVMNNTGTGSAKQMFTFDPHNIE
eukprot:CFRG2899T1